MDTPKNELVMCGDHPSSTYPKFELVRTESKIAAASDKLPCVGRVDQPASSSRMAGAGGGGSDPPAEIKRRVRSMEFVPEDILVMGNRNFIRAAVGSSRWPPYLLCVWVLVLLLTHALHCVVAVLDRVLPALKKTCVYFRNWTENTWRALPEAETNKKVTIIALFAISAVLYTVYYTLYTLYAIAIWSVEPLCVEIEERDVETKVTNYVDEIANDSFNK